jgi:N-carbamoyl-L-amino-acid hydrolase
MPMDCDLGLLDDLAKSADALGHSHLQLASGAGHDAAFIGQLAPAAMVFVPCLGGRSHTPEEWAEKHDIAAGAAAMFAAVRRFDERTPVTNQTHNSI